MGNAHALQPHICPVCQKRFDRKYMLKSHQREKQHRQLSPHTEKEMSRKLLQSYHQDKMTAHQEERDA